MSSKQFRGRATALAFSLLLLASGVAISAPKPAQPAKQTSDTMDKINQTVDDSVKKIKETLRIEPNKNDTPENRAHLSQMANQAVGKIEAAQTSIEANKLTEAKTQLGEAQTLLENIQKTEPTARVIDTVQTKRKQLQTSQTVAVDLVPLDGELVEFEKVTPAPKAKDHLKQAKQSLQDKKRTEATEHLATVEEHLIYAEADLPVSRTKQDVLGAQTLLNQNKPKEAQKLLTDSLKHIQILVMELDGKSQNEEMEVSPKY